MYFSTWWLFKSDVGCSRFYDWETFRPGIWELRWFKSHNVVATSLTKGFKNPAVEGIELLSVKMTRQHFVDNIRDAVECRQRLIDWVKSNYIRVL